MKRVSQAHLPVVALTHPGMQGKNNEDRFAVSAFRLDDSSHNPVLLAMLCDGIGGHRAGEVAAEIAVNRISQIVAQSDGSRPTHVLQEAATQASQEIHAMAQADIEQLGMGATFACAWIIDRRLYTGTVGDTRIYLLRGGTIQQLSTDHTWIQEALEHGLIRPEQVHSHPNAHVIRRYLGSENPPSVDFRLRLSKEEDDASAEANQGTNLQPGDILLLCSDGLSDLVEDNEMLAVFQQPANQLKAAQELIDLANARGGNDNITLITIRVPPIAAHAVKPSQFRGQRAKAAPPAGFPWRWLAIGCFGLAAFGLLVGVLAAGWFWYTGRTVAAHTPSPSLLKPQLLFKPSATPVTQTATAAVSPIPSQTKPQPLLPIDNGPTLTPWPTATPHPTPTATPSDTPTATNSPTSKP
jgi:protein phosphatase